MKAPQGFLPVSISSPDRHGRVDVGSSDAKLLVLDTDPGHAAFMKTACNNHESLVALLKDRPYIAGADGRAWNDRVNATLITLAGAA
ncbi:hypothetical protein [Herbaspirillum sp. YR522]|uniref:hypothetical protein n=1 Tax=Herbaspirillum sp. YR522 TaxID=1144342 RepID=UPI00026FA298|nr:hypothetical protein [Herbaspirillum sp. YR522]EJN06458.1 hypothetical protein PMI40_02244 [Herbaspirillum sp. YR522]